MSSPSCPGLTAQLQGTILPHYPPLPFPATSWFRKPAMSLFQNSTHPSRLRREERALDPSFGTKCEPFCTLSNRYLVSSCQSTLSSFLQLDWALEGLKPSIGNLSITNNLKKSDSKKSDCQWNKNTCHFLLTTTQSSHKTFKPWERKLHSVQDHILQQSFSTNNS